MSPDARLRKLEAEVPAETYRTLFDIMGDVETTVRVAHGVTAIDVWACRVPPDCTAAISEAVRAVVAVVDAKGAAAGQRWADRLREELVPEAVRVLPGGQWVGTQLIVGEPTNVTAWRAYLRGDIPDPPDLPRPMGRLL